MDPARSSTSSELATCWAIDAVDGAVAPTAWIGDPATRGVTELANEAVVLSLSRRCRGDAADEDPEPVEGVAGADDERAAVAPDGAGVPSWTWDPVAAWRNDPDAVPGTATPTGGTEIAGLDVVPTTASLEAAASDAAVASDPAPGGVPEIGGPATR